MLTSLARSSSVLLVVAACSGGTPQAPVDAGATTPPADGGLVAECQAKARNFQTLCAGDDVRPCVWGAYAELCATGRTQLLIDSMSCLDATTCRTFSDPNQGEACLQQVHASEESATAKAFIQQLCSSQCASMCPAMIGDMEVFPYLSDADVTALSSCSSSDVCSALAKKDAGPSACIAQNAGLSPFEACVN